MKIIDLGKMPWTDANGNTFPAHVFEIEGTDHKYIFDAECYDSYDASVWESELKQWLDEAVITLAANNPMTADYTTPHASLE